MNKIQKEFLIKIILEATNELSRYSSPYQSDTSIICYKIAKDYGRKIINLEIIKEIEHNPFHPRAEIISWDIHDKVLRQLNNLAKEELVIKRLDYGGEGKGRNYTFGRWSLTPKGRSYLSELKSEGQKEVKE